MGRSVWIPLLTGLAFQLLGVFVAMLLPETRPPKTAEQVEDIQESSEEHGQLDGQDKASGWWSKIYAQCQEIVIFLIQDRSVALLISTFFAATIGRRSIELLLQYVSNRYGWTLAQVCCSWQFRRPQRPQTVLT